MCTCSVASLDAFRRADSYALSFLSACESEPQLVFLLRLVLIKSSNQPRFSSHSIDLSNATASETSRGIGRIVRVAFSHSHSRMTAVKIDDSCSIPAPASRVPDRQIMPVPLLWAYLQLVLQHSARMTPTERSYQCAIIYHIACLIRVRTARY